MSDKEKRKQFDAFGAEDFVNALPKKTFSGDSISMRSSPAFLEEGAGGGLRLEGRVDFGDLFGGPRGYQDMGRMPQRGEDILYELPITLEEAAFGGEKRVSFRKERGGPRRSASRSPKELRREKLRVAEKGGR